MNNYSENSKPPAQLVIGSDEQTYDYAMKRIQAHFCRNKFGFNSQEIESCFCLPCKQIKRNQHPSVIFIEPDTEYKLKDIDVIFEKSKFSLDENEKFFFVLSKASKLTKATANKLLKTLEEPPRGYEFFLLSKNENKIIPTIKSRCLITHLSHDTEADVDHPILQYFLIPTVGDPFEFEKELKQQQLSAGEAIELIDDLATYFQKKILDETKKSNDETLSVSSLQNKLSFLQNKLRRPPQNGSANIFLKNIFLGFPK